VEKHIEDYLKALEVKDNDDHGVDERTVPQLKEKLDELKVRLKELKQREEAVKAHPDKQLSETDPDSRLMKQSTVGSLVGYNVQTAVDTEYKLIIAHEVTNSPVDRGQLLPIARLAQEAMGRDELTVLADRGYYKGTDIKSCVDEGMITLVPKSLTSNSGANGLFPRSAFKYDAKNNEYRCPANQILKNVRTEMSLNVLAYNLRRMISIFGVSELIKVVKAAAVYCFSVVVRLFKRLESKKYSWQYQHPVKINLGRRALNAI